MGFNFMSQTGAYIYTQSLNQGHEPVFWFWSGSGPKEFTLFFFYSPGNGSVEMNSLNCILLHNKWILDEMQYTM